MNRFQVEAFFREFPFLSKYVSAEDVRDPKVSRINPDLFEKHCRSRFFGESVFKKIWTSSIYLLDKSGEKLLTVGCDFRWVEETPIPILAAPWTWPFLFMPHQPGHAEIYRLDNFDNPETVGEAVARFAKPEDIYYALEILPWEDGRQIVLYKPPKGFTLMSWLQEEHRRASQEVQAQIATIDAEAEVKA